MSNKQITWIWSKVQKHFTGVPDPDVYVWELGELWETIKKKSHNSEEAQQAFRMLCVIRSILDAAAEEGVRLNE